MNPKPASSNPCQTSSSDTVPTGETPCGLLFVYGTLRQGFDHEMAHYLAANSRWLGPAKAAGRLYDLGRYPAMVAPQAVGQWVWGDVYELNAPEKVLAVLDRYEGCSHGEVPPFEFERQRLAVQLVDGETCSCWVYLYQGSGQENQQIDSGDYLRHGPADPGGPKDCRPYGYA